MLVFLFLLSNVFSICLGVPHQSGDVYLAIINDSEEVEVTQGDLKKQDKIGSSDQEEETEGCPSNLELRERLDELESQIQASTKDIQESEDRITSLEEKCSSSEDEKIIPPSCEFIDATESGHYLISPDPDRLQPFYVFCDFSGDERRTVIKHDSLQEIEADANCEDQQCYNHNVNYNANMNQIVALIGISENCRQFIKYRCYGSVLFQGSDFFGSWVSRNGVAQNYWGGATSERDFHCACGETGTCLDPNMLCNCDYNRPPETFDEGYLTDKSKLPVTAVRFGDLTDSDGERGWHTIGGRECTGLS